MFVCVVCMCTHVFVCLLVWHVCMCGVCIYLCVYIFVSVGCMCTCVCVVSMCVYVYTCAHAWIEARKSPPVFCFLTLPYSFDIGSLTKAGVRQGSGTVLFLPVHSWVFIWCWEFKLRPSCFYRVWFFPVSGLSQ